MDGMEESQNKTNIIVTKVKPKHLPVVCPTCRGFGTLKFGTKKCNGCAGKTYILVDAEEVK